MMAPIDLYPLCFDPILKPKVWGGKKLHQLLGKNSQENIGESWELSGVEGSISKVTNGSLAGKTLSELISEYEETLLGKSVYEKFGNQFPLLFKFIDASQDLSIQVHPNDAIAQKRHNSFGKSEMWYVLQADEGARLILGFKEGVDKTTYLNALEQGELGNIMREVPVHEGDAFYLNTGTVHAIGGGIVLAEIQQSSDITYRIYDWDRPDTDGNFRKLHTQEALDVMSFSTSREAELKIEELENRPVTLCISPYFHTSLLKITKPMRRDYSAIDSFIVYMCTEGQAELVTESDSIQLQKGTTILLPACLKEARFEFADATILEVYVPSA